MPPVLLQALQRDYTFYLGASQGQPAPREEAHVTAESNALLSRIRDLFGF